ncbi:MAG TPA: permease prefix domain 1-containing protein, partial [Longimicrobiales bacterium]|nr:permease prefix domain 1-containing protein [Longimicrobiales bacterium]
MDDEIRGHIELRARALEQGGMSRDQAWAEARSAFGPTETIRSECRDIQREILRRRRARMRVEEVRGELGSAVR